MARAPGCLGHLADSIRNRAAALPQGPRPDEAAAQLACASTPQPRTTRDLAMRRIVKVAALAASLFAVAPVGGANAQSADPNDTARFLAGMQPSAGAPLAALTQDHAWQQHARRFDAVFGNIDSRRLQEYPGVVKREAHLAQPGAVLHVQRAGLPLRQRVLPERVHLRDERPRADRPDSRSNQTVPRVRSSRALARHRGVAALDPGLQLFPAPRRCARARSPPASAARFRSSTCSLPAPEKLFATYRSSGSTRRDRRSPTMHRCLRTQARRAAPRSCSPAPTGAKRRSTISAPTSPMTASRRAALRRFCERLGAGDAFRQERVLPACTSSHFSDVRNFLLARSRVVLQDDSGVPVSLFESGSWQLRPFGHYSGPIGLFAGKYQPKLAHLFDRGRVNSINFGVGYHWRPRSSNLMIAARTAASAPDAVASTPPDASKPELQVISSAPPSTPDILQADTAAQERKSTTRNRSGSQAGRPNAKGTALFCLPCPVVLLAWRPALMKIQNVRSPAVRRFRGASNRRVRAQSALPERASRGTLPISPRPRTRRGSSTRCAMLGGTRPGGTTSSSQRNKRTGLVRLPPTHHPPLPPMPVSSQRNHGSRVVSTGVLQHIRAPKRTFANAWRFISCSSNVEHTWRARVDPCSFV